MRRDQLPLATLDGRTAALRLAHPCPCDQPHCRTLAEHILQATRDMTPGPRAQSFEPSISGNGTGGNHDTILVADPTTTIDRRFNALLDVYWNAALNLTRFIDAHRPDRWTPLPEPATDQDWCRNHLEHIGACEPRHRGDLCRTCYDLQLAHGQLPDPELMRIRDRRGYLTDRDITEWRTRLPKTVKRKRKK